MTLFRRLFLPNKTRDSDPSDNWRIIERWAEDNYNWALRTPRGVLTYGAQSANQGPIVGVETTITGLSISYTTPADSNRLVIARSQVFLADSNANERVGIFIRVNGSRVGYAEYDTPGFAAVGFTIWAESFVFTLTAGTTYTFTSSIQRVAGAGNLTVFGTSIPSTLQVYDLGAA